MADLAISTEYGNVELDNFFKTLMFQKIMDSGFTRNERDTLLVIFRKTIHFDKWEDNLSMYWLSRAVGIGETTLRITLRRLEDKSLISFIASSGGKTKSPKKYNAFGISGYLINDVYRAWVEIKEENGISLKYID